MSGKEVRAGRKYKMVAEGKIRKLIIKDVTPEDELDYTCTIGELKSTASLFVKRESALNYFLELFSL